MLRLKMWAFTAIALSLVLGMLGGCDSSQTTPVPAAGTTPAATAASTVAPTAAPRTISGRISYAGSIQPTHQIVVVAVRQGEQAPAYSATVRQPGPYTLSNVTDATYQVTAFMDLGDDMGPPQPNEPTGAYDANGDGKPDEVIVKDGKAMTGIDIAIRDAR